MIRRPFNFKQWIDEHRHLLKLLMRNRCIAMKLITTSMIVGLFSIAILGQKGPAFSIGTTKFICPAGFVMLPEVDRKTRLFQSKDKENSLYLFVSVPTGEFVDSTVKKAIENQYAANPGNAFQWKPVKNPMTMDVKTKHENRVTASFGLWDKHLVELKAFIFSVKGKIIVIGYASDWGEEPWLNKRLFDKGEGLGDTAVGCNAVVTLLNSITREFKEKKQYCSLSAFTN